MVWVVDSLPAASCESFLIDVCAVFMVGMIEQILSIPSLDAILLSGLESLP